MAKIIDVEHVLVDTFIKLIIATVVTGESDCNYRCTWRKGWYVHVVSRYPAWAMLGTYLQHAHSLGKIWFQKQKATNQNVFTILMMGFPIQMVYSFQKGNYSTSILPSKMESITLPSKLG